MSIQVDFYNFYKDDKSTARPGASQLSASLSCEIKQPCSIITPRIITDIARPGSATDYAFYNYCVIIVYFYKNYAGIKKSFGEFFLKARCHGRTR